ncbi:hypothetical protein FXO37_03705 [Capsicum annuum]|nr:hypothetical protein FXO37_03705 [Capsicum annuum]
MKGSYEAITHRTSPDIYDFYKLFDAGYWQVYIQETFASGTTKLSDTDEDIFQLKTTTVGLLNDLGCNGFTLSEDLINEMSQYDASELHAIASFVGEFASQEVIKLITRQFIPMSGNFIFNGVDHKSQLLLFTKPGSFRLHSSWQIAFLMENVKRKVCHATLDLQTILYAFKLSNSDVTVLLVRLLFVEVCDYAPLKNSIIGILCFPSYMDKINILFTDVVKILEDGDLQTLGMLDYNKRLQHSFTAHSKVDPVTDLPIILILLVIVRYEMRFNMKNGLASQKKLSESVIDFPRVNENYIGKSAVTRFFISILKFLHYMYKKSRM